VAGTLRYSLTASETLVPGNGNSNRGTSSYTSLSGNLAYLSGSTNHPFSAVYSGGYLIGNTAFSSYPFHNLSLSQVLKTKNWDFIFADNVSYLPQSPVTGLSGIPGAGDLNVPPVVVGPGAGLGILTTYAQRVSNVVSGTATRHLTASTSAYVTGSYLIQRYTGTTASGIDNDQEDGSFGVTHRLDARSGIGASYMFSNSAFRFPLNGALTQGGYRTQSVQASYNRQLTRLVGFQVSAGPQFIQPASNILLSKSSTGLMASASLNRTGETYNTGLFYARSINNGGGVVTGTRSDVVGATVSRSFARVFNAAGTLGYNRSTSLPGTNLSSFTSNGVVAGGQLTAQVARSVSVFGSYSLQRQLFTGTTPYGNSFNGLTHYISFGITYSPKPLFSRK
jgi:hypothetical protein